MKTKIAICLLVAALLPACMNTRTAATNNHKTASYADNASQVAPPGEGPAADIPAEGPPDVKVNPAYVPTPVLRDSAASHP